MATGFLPVYTVMLFVGVLASGGVVLYQSLASRTLTSKESIAVVATATLVAGGSTLLYESLIGPFGSYNAGRMLFVAYTGAAAIALALPSVRIEVQRIVGQLGPEAVGAFIVVVGLGVLSAAHAENVQYAFSDASRVILWALFPILPIFSCASANHHVSLMAGKRYGVKLSIEQRSRLLEWIGRGERPAGEQRRARVLLKADEGSEGPAWPDERIAEAFELSAGGVAGIRRRFCQRGLEGTVRRKAPDREYERKLDGEKEAELIRLACSEAPDGRSAWSLRLLADEMVELGIVDTLSHETVRRTLKKTD